METMFKRANDGCHQITLILDGQEKLYCSYYKVNV